MKKDMKNKLTYKGYFTLIHFSAQDRVLYGKIEGIADLIAFESDSAVQIEQEFRAAVDDYIESCKRNGKEPATPPEAPRG